MLYRYLPEMIGVISREFTDRKIIGAVLVRLIKKSAALDAGFFISYNFLGKPKNYFRHSEVM
jgi:hypothetical protein